MENVRKDKTFIPEKYHMVFCPHCKGFGKIYWNDKESRVCTVCGGFGAIKKPEDKLIQAHQTELWKGEILGMESEEGLILKDRHSH